MIQADGLVKRYGTRVAVDHLSFTVEPGFVTGFLGPNGSGKSTTMRLLLGLDRPDEGSSTFGGRPYRALSRPLTEVGALLDAAYVHPTRSGRAHLAALAASNGLANARVDEVLAMVGLSDVGAKRVGTYSLGMKQRLGIAAAMLGDPHTLLFDEPANGLDPEGVRWIREFLAYLAHQGRTVFVSSHVLSEMSLMADRLVVIGQGRLMAQSDVESFVARFTRTSVKVSSPNLATLSQVLTAAGARVEFSGPCDAVVYDLSAAAIGQAAADAGVALHQLADQSGSLEDAYLELTNASVEYRGGA